jgi:hypothetical protein
MAPPCVHTGFPGSKMLALPEGTGNTSSDLSESSDDDEDIAWSRLPSIHSTIIHDTVGMRVERTRT